MNKLIEKMEARICVVRNRFDRGYMTGMRDAIALVKKHMAGEEQLTESQRNDFENFVEQILGCGWVARNDAQHDNIKRWWLTHFAKAEPVAEQPSEIKASEQGNRCACRFQDGRLVEECHYHAAQHTGTAINGDPISWHVESFGKRITALEKEVKASELLPLLKAIIEHVGCLQVHPWHIENIKLTCVKLKAELAKLERGGE